MKSNIHSVIPRSVLLGMGKFQIKVVEKVETQISYSISVSKIIPFMR